MDGILLVKKEANMTSHDVVFKLRKILGTKKIGHTGTLDPNVTGLLVVLVGKACKVLPYLEDTDKEYVGSLVLGKMSTTEDIWGDLTEEKEITPIENFNEVLQSFQGQQKQLPPMISSIKVNGRKLYEYARNNEEVERPLRDVTFYKLESLDDRQYGFRVLCSSGTYMRSLCRDIGTKTNNLAIMSELERTRVGTFMVEQASTLDEIREGQYTLHTIAEALAYLPVVTNANLVDVRHGKTLKLDRNEPLIAIYDRDEVIAIYEKKEHYYKMARGLW